MLTKNISIHLILVYDISVVKLKGKCSFCNFKMLIITKLSIKVILVIFLLLLTLTFVPHIFHKLLKCKREKGKIRGTHIGPPPSFPLLNHSGPVCRLSINSLFIKCQYCLHLTSATKVLENFEKSHVKQEP